MDRKLKLLFYETFTSKCLYPHVRLIACRVRLFATLWTVAQQAPLSLGFSRQEYWSGLPGPPPGDLPDPGMEPVSLMSLKLASRFFTTSTTWEALWPLGEGHSLLCEVFMALKDF